MSRSYLLPGGGPGLARGSGRVHNRASDRASTYLTADLLRTMGGDCAICAGGDGPVMIFQCSVG